MKTKELIKEWYKFYSCDRIKNRTAERYRGVIDKYILPYLGETEIDTVERKTVQEFLYSLRAIGGDYGLSASSVNVVHSVLKSAFAYACEAEMLEINPCERIRRVPVQGRKAEAFTREEQEKIEKAVSDTEDGRLVGVLICLYTGLRIGELLALEWSDVDFRRGILIIRKTVYRGRDENGGWRVCVDTPKTASSERIVPLPYYIIDMLKKQKRMGLSEFVIENKKAERMSVRSYQYLFERLTATAGVRSLNFHALRHTFATRALESGMDIKTLSEIMGHSNATITLNRYAHSMLDNKIAVMRRFPRIG